jgi:hypothetical protein
VVWSTGFIYFYPFYFSRKFKKKKEHMRNYIFYPPAFLLMALIAAFSKTPTQPVTSKILGDYDNATYTSTITTLTHGQGNVDTQYNATIELDLTGNTNNWPGEWEGGYDYVGNRYYIYVAQVAGGGDGEEVPMSGPSNPLTNYGFTLEDSGDLSWVSPGIWDDDDVDLEFGHELKQSNGKYLLRIAFAAVWENLSAPYDEKEVWIEGFVLGSSDTNWHLNGGDYWTYKEVGCNE